MTQCVLLVLCWSALCAVVLTSNARIDGVLILSIIISGALVFIPVLKAIKSRNK